MRYTAERCNEKWCPGSAWAPTAVRFCFSSRSGGGPSGLGLASIRKAELPRPAVPGGAWDRGVFGADRSAWKPGTSPVLRYPGSAWAPTLGSSASRLDGSVVREDLGLFQSGKQRFPDKWSIYRQRLQVTVQSALNRVVRRLSTGLCRGCGENLPLRLPINSIPC